MFVGEVEEEDVVGLAVNGFLNGVGLVCDEGGEYAEVAHAGDDVIPVRFPQIEVCFFSERNTALSFQFERESTNFPRAYSTTIWRSIFEVFLRFMTMAPP